MDFAVSADHKVKLKENVKKDKQLHLARELKKQWNIKVTIIPIVIGVLGKVTKLLLMRLEDLVITERVETIQTTTLLRSVIILRRVLETSRRTVTQTPVKDYELTLMWKTLKD